MQYKLVFEIKNYVIYCCYDKEICYYVSIPKNNKYNYQLSIDLDRYIEIESVNKNLAYNKIFEAYSSMDNTSLILILPIITKEAINKLTLKENYIKLAKILTKIITNAHQILMKNKITFDNIINFIDDLEYQEFLNWLSNTYIGKISYISIIDIYKKYDIALQISKDNINQVSVQGMNFVIGSSDTANSNNNNMITIDDIPIQNDDKVITNHKLLNADGKVNYIFLGIICTITIIATLFILIKK